MAMKKPGVDLEKELNCSICTELLFQPLTLLDCLHSFCGSCLKDWFEWQKHSAENSPTPPAPGATIFTCPSCRAPVRDTRRNATVTSLLDIFLASNPDKVKPEDEQEELRQKYKPGDNVLPHVNLPERSADERRADRLERQMIEQAREMSLRDAGVESSSRRRHAHSRSEGGSRTRSDRDHSQGHRDARYHVRREDERMNRHSMSSRLHPQSQVSDDRQHRHSESRHGYASQQPSRDSSRVRQVEHQASIRSLITSSNGDERDIEQEIDDLARQIQEEGLLDGLDLDNLDLTQNDELSRKITEAYRRRQRERSHAHAAARLRSNSENPTSRSQPALILQRPPVTDHLHPNRHRASSMQTGSSGLRNQVVVEDRSRRPSTSAHLEVYPETERRRRRSSGARSATEPVRPRTADSRLASHSQTDLPLRSHSSDPSSRDPSVSRGQDTVVQVETPSDPPSSGEQSSEGPRDLSFSGRAAVAVQLPENPVPPPLFSVNDESGGDETQRQRRPTLVAPQPPLPSLGLMPSPVHRTHNQHSRAQYYQEPSITCVRCQRSHIEYEVHYNCAHCAGGQWNICRQCYREGKGCQNWYGFGYAAIKKWEKKRAAVDYPLETPHMLSANRYLPPYSMPGGAEGRKTLSTEDPALRLESGLFCVRCSAWSNECYWRCDVCNDGDWGFCNSCVNQGYACTHPLLPLAHIPPPASPLPISPLATPTSTPPASPGLRRLSVHRRPRTATLSKGPNALGAGDYRPLTFTVLCDICQNHIPPPDFRYHCNSCPSSAVPESQPGDYNVCAHCYEGLVQDGSLSEENGPAGWRRCPSGHRMNVVGYVEGKAGLKRVVMQDMVGGNGLTITALEDDQALQCWYWHVGDTKVQRLATVNVAECAPEQEEDFPPNGGTGLRGSAMWSWYPAADADDELMFPRGAELREIEDVNGDWCFGSYMGARGLFPAPYVRIVMA